MQNSVKRSTVDMHKKSRDFIARFKSDASGVTIIEFALLALPFFYIIFGIIGYGMYLFTNIALDAAGEAAARDVRTGQAQGRDETMEQFKQRVCTEAGGVLDCSRLKVFVQSGAEWTDINPPACVAQDGNGDNVQAEGSDTVDGDGNAISIEAQGGGAEAIFLMTLCYEFTLAQLFPQLGFSTDLSNGSSIIQSATTFRIEPFQDS